MPEVIFNGHALYYGPTGTVTEIAGVVNGSIAMIASATLTVAINATPITDGALVFNSNYSAGDKVTATPTADNVLADRDEIHVTQSGLNLVAGTATLYLRVVAKP